MAKRVNDELRAKYVEVLAKAMAELGEDVLVVGSNELAIPTIDSEGNDNYVVFTVKVPTGSRDGDAYDPYALADEYKAKQAEKTEKALERAKAKAEKAERDKKVREERAAAKAKAKAEK